MINWFSTYLSRSTQIELKRLVLCLLAQEDQFKVCRAQVRAHTDVSFPCRPAPSAILPVMWSQMVVHHLVTLSWMTLFGTGRVVFQQMVLRSMSQLCNVWAWNLRKLSPRKSNRRPSRLWMCHQPGTCLSGCMESPQPKSGCWSLAAIHVVGRNGRHLKRSKIEKISPGQFMSFCLITLMILIYFVPMHYPLGVISDWGSRTIGPSIAWWHSEPSKHESLRRKSWRLCLMLSTTTTRLGTIEKTKS